MDWLIRGSSEQERGHQREGGQNERGAQEVGHAKARLPGISSHTKYITGMAPRCHAESDTRVSRAHAGIASINEWTVSNIRIPFQRYFGECWNQRTIGKFSSGGVLDLTFALREPADDWAANVKSTRLVPVCYLLQGQIVINERLSFQGAST